MSTSPTSSNPPGSPGRAYPPAPPQAGRYVAECGRALGAVVPPLLAGLFDKVDDTLYDLADKAANNRQYTVYFDAMRIVRKQSRVVQNAFLRLLRQGAETLLSGQPGPELAAQEVDIEAAGIMPNSELEEVLAVENLISKSESRYRRELMEMSFFMGGILGRPGFDSRSNPYGPHAICHAFRHALATARQLQPQIRLVIYKLFDKQVMDRLGDYYTGCVDAAVAAGYRPGSGLAHRLRSAASPAAAARQAAEPLRRAAPGAAPVAFDFAQIQELLERLRALGAASTGAPPGAGQARPGEQRADQDAPASVELATGELLALLTNLGARALVDERADTLAPLSREVAKSPSGAPRSLAKNDEDTLDLVFLFFEHLLQGNNLPDGLKALIGRMQIPVAKLALLDKGFFSDAEHPARKLLNHIGEAAVGWSDDDERTPDSLHGMIERVVERLILDFDGDPALFARMDRFFVAYLAHQAAKAQEAEAEVLASLGSQASDSERHAVLTALNACLVRYPNTPAAAEAILRNGWQPAMLAICQREGPGCIDWQLGIEVADRLLWSVQPKPDPEQRRQLLSRIPEILRNLRTLLAASGCDRRQQARWLKDLQTLHLGVLQGTSATSAAATADARADSAGPAPREGNPGLGVGDWIELTRDDGSRVRLKVAWVGQEAGGYLLVDRHGRRGPDLSETELAALMDQGLVERLSNMQEPIADRALRSVLRRLSP